MKKFCLTLAMVSLIALADGAAPRAQQGARDPVWTRAGLVSRTTPRPEERGRPAKLRAYGRFTAQEAHLRQALRTAPREGTRGGSLAMTVPMPDGSLERIRVEESPIFSPELQEAYSYARTYRASGVDDLTLSGRLDMTPAGFHGMLMSARGTVFVDPAGDGTGEYVSYWKRDAIGDPIRCLTHPDDMLSAGGDDFGVMRLNPSGGQLRTYRLAVSVTGEYTRFFDGNPPAAGTPATISQITTTVNRVNGVYERELAIRLVLTATRIFTDPATDPFTSGDFRTENQTELDANVGNDNYDIGHVLGQGGSGGVATGGVVCVGGSKARGYTSLANPSGDPFDIDFVAHEIGHQFSARHTWTANTGSCSSVDQFQATAAYEPGSGSTIMAYAGICGAQNVQANSDAYFHTHNYDEIVAFRTSGNGSTCGALPDTGNGAPTVNAGPGCTVPTSTPFTLTATGSDPNGDALTYNWEQFDLGTQGAAPVSSNATGPMFRSRPATTSPSRTFPQMADILSGAATPWEVLPSVNRTLAFRVTARDNRAGGGGVSYDTTTVTVSGAPFEFTFPTTGSALECGGSAAIAWNVGGGSIATDVSLQLSTDGAATFPLSVSTANDGAHTITVPRTLTALGRMRLVPSAQCFFAVSRQFSITDTLPPSITAPPAVVAECTGPTATTVALGTASASDQCDASVTVSNNAPVPPQFPLGTTNVTWTARDDSGHTANAAQTVTIQDTTAPVISCNAPATMTPSSAPTSFTASAADVCDTAPTAIITAARCYAVNGSGKVVNRASSCVVSFAGDTLTVHDSGGVNDVIEWDVESQDASGNRAATTCSVAVVRK